MSCLNLYLISFENNFRIRSQKLWIKKEIFWNFQFDYKWTDLKIIFQLINLKTRLNKPLYNFVIFLAQLAAPSQSYNNPQNFCPCFFANMFIYMYHWLPTLETHRASSIPDERNMKYEYVANEGTFTQLKATFRGLCT